MNYNQTFPNPETPKSNQPNQNNIICHCSCCQCCCPCCYCQCNCQCHQQSIIQNEENKKLNENFINQDSLNRKNNNYQNYQNFPSKYGNQKINDDVDFFNQQLINMKMRTNNNNSNKKNNSFSNTTNDNSPNVSKNFNSSLMRNINNNFYENENFNPCNNYNNLNNMKIPNDDFINRNEMNNVFNQNNNDFNNEYTFIKPMKKKENQRPYSSNRRNINILSNNDINNYDSRNYYNPDELNFLSQTEYNNNYNNKLNDSQNYHQRNSFDRNYIQTDNRSFVKLNEPKKRVFNSKFHSNSNNNYYKQISKNQRNSFSKKNKLYIQNFRLNIINDYQSNLTDSNYESKNVSTNRNNLIVQELKDEINKLKNEVLNLKNENGNLQKILNNFNNDDNNNNNQIINLENENKELIDNLNILKNNVVNLENENKELIENLNLLKDNAFNLENEKNKLLNDLKNFNILKNENKKMKEQLILYQSKEPDKIKLNKNLTPNKNYDDENSNDEILFENQGKTFLTSNNKLKNANKINKYNSFDNLQIQNEKLTYKGIPYTEEELIKKISKTSSKRKILGPSISSSKLMTKLKIETDLNIIQPKKSNIKIINNIEDLGDNIILKYNNKNIMCYDMNNKKCYFFDYADYNNFSDNFINDEDNGNIFLSYNTFLYILTGKNYDMFYSFNPQKKAMEKLCSLKNNHSKGCLIPYNDNSIICLSGQHNKKCEIYSILKNEWNDMPEMNIERSEFGCCIIQNKYLFCIFGFNYPKNEYLNTIEYLDLLDENPIWKYLIYNNDNLISLYIKGLLCINYIDEKIILVGGFNGELNKPVEDFYQLILGHDFEKDCYVESVNRKLKDIQKKNYIYVWIRNY